MEITRAKMFVSSANEIANEYGTQTFRRPILTAAFSPDPSTENNRFFKSTPNGKFTVSEADPLAATLTLGSYWYVDVRPLEEGEALQDGEIELQLVKAEMQGSWAIGVDLRGVAGVNAITQMEMTVSNDAVWPLFSTVGRHYAARFIPAVKS